MDIQILVVEDDEHICNTMQAFLQEEGYKVDVCYNGDKHLTLQSDVKLLNIFYLPANAV